MLWKILWIKKIKIEEEEEEEEEEDSNIQKKIIKLFTIVELLVLI